MSSSYNYLRSPTIIAKRTGRSLFIFIKTYKKNLKMRINEHRKKGCDKVVDSKRDVLKLKLYPPLKNATKGVHLKKGWKHSRI
jgi:hypothetical protein